MDKNQQKAAEKRCKSKRRFQQKKGHLQREGEKKNSGNQRNSHMMDAATLGFNEGKRKGV